MPMPLGSSPLSVSVVEQTQPRSSSTPLSDSRAKFQLLVRRYYHQLAIGCGSKSCTHRLCVSCSSGPRLSKDAAALMAIQLASRPRHYFCPRCPEIPEQGLASDVLSPLTATRSTSHSNNQRSNKEARPFLYTLLDSTPFRGLFENGNCLNHSPSDKETTVSHTGGLKTSNNPNARRRSQSLGYLASLKFLNFSSSTHQDTSDSPTSPIQTTTPQYTSSATKTIPTATSTTLIDHSSCDSTRSHTTGKSNMSRTKSAMDLPSMMSGLGLHDLVIGASVSRLHSRHSSTETTTKDDTTHVQNQTSNLCTCSVDALSDNDSVELAESVAHSLDSVSSDNDVNLDLNRVLETHDPKWISATLRNIFASPHILSKTFDGKSGGSAKDDFAAFLSNIRLAYARIFAGEFLSKDEAVMVMTDATELWIAKMELANRRWGADSVASLIAVLENPLLKDRHFHDSLLKRLCGVIARLRRSTKAALASACSKYDVLGFRNIVNVFQAYLDDHFHQSPGQKQDQSVVDCVKVLSLFYHANETVKPRLLHIHEFYNETIGRKLNFKEEYKLWRKSLETKPVTIFSFFNYPFLFDPVAKTRILHIDAMVQMSLEFEDAFVNQALIVHAQRFLPDSNTAATLEKGMKTKTNPYFVLEIRREHLVKDTLSQILKGSNELKKPLKVKFVGGGEEGMDQGGVQKEFFQVLLNRLLDPNYGMFVDDPETRFLWINGHSLEPERHFELVGSVIGLALYNGVILGMNFPLLVYKKLLDEPITLEDVQDAFPSLGRGLQQLLDWEDGDVSDVFMRNFVIDYPVYGSIKTFPLCENGADIPVTNENRKEFVQLYINHLVHESTRRQFTAFRRGFWNVCGGKALKMCRAEELDLLVCGSVEFDFSELEKGAQYDDGYSPEHPLMIHLWQVIHEMTHEQKKKLLMFVTASDRIPLKGLGHVTFVVQRNGPDTERLPTALTCFGRLLLPEYSGKEKLREKLLTAIENAKGFGLV